MLLQKRDTHQIQTKVTEFETFSASNIFIVKIWGCHLLLTELRINTFLLKNKFITHNKVIQANGGTANNKHRCSISEFIKLKEQHSYSLFLISDCVHK